MNAINSITNLIPGEFDVGMVLPIGWDFGDIGSTGQVRDYVIDQPVDGYVSVTLAWDRRVDKTGENDRYNFGDQFINETLSNQLNNLDLYLMDVNENNIANAIRASTSLDDSVEHIFFEVPSGNYKIRVLHSGGIGDFQEYGLAWWAGKAPMPPSGDFDGDGDVDGDDLSQWEGDYGQNGDSDADGDGDSDGADFLAWQRNFGFGALSASTAVPEPATGFLLLLGVMCAPQPRRTVLRKLGTGGDFFNNVAGRPRGGQLFNDRYL